MLEVSWEDKGLGRIPFKDPRNLSFMMAASPLLDSVSVLKKPTTWRMPGIPLDQGALPWCTEYSARHLLMGEPVRRSERTLPPYGDFYHMAQLVDAWPGEDYDGTSVAAMVKILHKLGYISEYRWSYTAEPVRVWIQEVSPVLFGIRWTRDMFYPEPSGLIHPTGEDRGGHAIICYRYDPRPVAWDPGYDHYWLYQSWGPLWGKDGRCCLRGTDVDALIREGGEALSVREIPSAIKRLLIQGRVDDSSQIG